MVHPGYTCSMRFDVEDKIIVGRVLGIDGIICCHGSTVAEFEAAFHAAIDGLIDGSIDG